jgi:hypothetical protein
MRRSPPLLGNEGLMHPKPSGELLLGEASSIARLDQQLAKSCLAKRMDGFSDSARARGHRRGRLIRTSDYPKTGYYAGTELCLWRAEKGSPMPITASAVRIGASMGSQAGQAGSFFELKVLPLIVDPAPGYVVA